MTANNAPEIGRETTSAETAYAKVNLALHVRRRLDNGYHELETLFAFVDGGDIVAARPADGLSLQISGPFAAGLCEDDNLTLDAARALQRRADRQDLGVRLTLQKNLPVASGIGGGSADAAAVLRLLNRIWGVNLSLPELAKIAEPLGADIPACLYSRIMRGEGTGVQLSPVDIPEISGLYILLVNPMVAVSTKEVFKAWDGVDNGPLKVGMLDDIAGEAVNGLQPAAIESCPQIAPLLRQLEQTGAALARMSGSGATCFALYEAEQARDAAAQQILSVFPGYWTMRGQLL